MVDEALRKRLPNKATYICDHMGKIPEDYIIRWPGIPVFGVHTCEEIRDERPSYYNYQKHRTWTTGSGDLTIGGIFKNTSSWRNRASIDNNDLIDHSESYLEDQIYGIVLIDNNVVLSYETEIKKIYEKVCDPNLPECMRWNIDLTYKETKMIFNVTRYIPGNWERSLNAICKEIVSDNTSGFSKAIRETRHNR